MKRFMPHLVKVNLLDLIRHQLESVDIHNPQIAHLICRLIPASCPFERDIKLGNQTLFHIPPLCKLNPFYEQFVMLRFKSLVCLADEYGQDITLYC